MRRHRLPLEFLKIAQHTPGFREIVEATIRIPSIWTAVKHLNFGASFDYDFKNIQRLDGKTYGLASPNACVLPFGLIVFGKRVASGTWLATSPRPPLLASAGILALTVEPTDNTGKHLELRVIAARNAPL